MAIQYNYFQSLSGATPTWDLSLYQWAEISASGNVAVTLSGAVDPSGAVLHFLQDATGSRTLTLNGNAIPVNTAASTLTRVEVSYVNGKYVFSVPSTQITITASQLTAPTLTATAASSSVINLSWNDVANESSYKIQESTDGGSTWADLSTPAANATSYSRTGLTASTTYSYRIKAVGNGTTYTDSNYSNTASATTNAPASFIDSYTWLSRFDTSKNLTTVNNSGTLQVSEWNDQAWIGTLPHPNVYDLKQLTTADQPLYIASGINGKPVIYPSGTKNIVTGSYNTAWNRPFTRFLVVQFQSITASAVKYVTYGGSTSRADFGYWSDGKMFMYSGAALKSTSSVVAGVTYIVCLQFAGDSVNDKMWINGTLEATGSSGTIQTFTGFRFGYSSSAPPADFYVGDALIANGIISDSDRNSIIDELKTKWGVA